MWNSLWEFTEHAFCRNNRTFWQKIAVTRTFWAFFRRCEDGVRHATLENEGLLKGAALRLRDLEKKTSRFRNILPEKALFLAKSAKAKSRNPSGLLFRPLCQPRKGLKCAEHAHFVSNLVVSRQLAHEMLCFGAISLQISAKIFGDVFHVPKTWVNICLIAFL